MKHSPLLEAVDLTFSHGNSSILESIDLAIYPNTVTTIIGPNGGGKSTLLRLLCGLEAPTRGEVITQHGLRIGYMPQSLQIPELLPIDVITLLRLYRRITEAESMAVLQETGVERLARRQFHTLSGGERQRVLLAQALVTEPQVLMLDEPVQNVDIAGQATLYRLIEEVAKRRQCAVILVSHDLHFVLASSDHVICLNHHICCAGHPQAVRHDQAYKALFGDSPIAPYIHHHDHDHAD
jgi:zinc transport system ATP-binding protein